MKTRRSGRWLRNNNGGAIDVEEQVSAALKVPHASGWRETLACGKGQAGATPACIGLGCGRRALVDGADNPTDALAQQDYRSEAIKRSG